ncbi:MAG TPA: acyl-ACP thioesterase domain-containing protein [Acidimicrobiales bacterium]
MLDAPLVPPPDAGRVFRAERRVRLGDADRSGRLRLDACARYLQDLGNDDTADSGIDQPGTTWVVRRAVIDVHGPPVWGEEVTLSTWCGGIGGRWAGRRLAMRGRRGGHVEIDTLWVHIDIATGVPTRLPDRFLDRYAEAAQGRRISSRLWLGEPPPDAAMEPWPLRAVDIDLLGHVNNAAYWAAVEQMARDERGERGTLLAAPHRAVMEYGPGIDPGDAVDLLVHRDDARLSLWFAVGGTVRAAATVVRLPAAAGHQRSVAASGAASTVAPGASPVSTPGCSPPTRSGGATT